MNRLLKILLSQNSLRKTLGFTNYFSATKFDHHLQISPDLNFKNILVLAPHPDDDVFGCGGTLAVLAKKNAQITVAYFCDGSGGVQREGGKRDPNLVEIRKQEARQAGKILKYHEQVFFGYQDGKLAAGTSVNKAFSDLIKRVKPDIILTPSFLDNHPDHRAVNEVLINCSVCPKEMAIWSYEIWTPVFVNRLIDISAVIDDKKKAILAQESQLNSRGYDKAIIGLNQYRAEVNGLPGYAEGFFATTLEIYKKLYQKS